MPLAVLRTTPTAWPIAFTLDDSLRMSPGLVLSKFARGDIVARISRSGNAAVQPGDLDGRVANIALGPTTFTWSSTASPAVECVRHVPCPPCEFPEPKEEQPT